MGHDAGMNFSPWAVAVLSFASIGCTSLQHPHRAQAVPNAPAVAVQDPLDSIARLEDMRTDGEGLLEALAARGEERTRVRAVRALGRLPRDEYGAAVSDALAEALEDRAENVRAAAAFALGLRADSGTTGALIAAADEGTPQVRARAVEALSRIDDPRARRKVIDAIDSDLPAVAQMAAIGVHRFPANASESPLAETQLVQRITVANVNDPSASPTVDDELRWRALSTLARRACVGARDNIELAAPANDPRVRLFAMQGLGAIPSDERASSILRAALQDPDWRVACEASTALGKHADVSAVPALIEACARSVPPLAAHHVRRCAFDALGRIPGAGEAARAALAGARDDAAPEVRAAAIEAGARLYRSAFAATLENAARNENAIVRAGAAAAAAYVPADVALPTLDALMADADLRVATTAAEALGAHMADPRARDRILTALSASDNGVRLAAATALAKEATTDDLPALERALATTRGEIAPEVAAAVVAAVAHVGGERALAVLRFAIANPDPYVSRKARAASLAIRPDARLPRSPAPPRRANGELPPIRTGSNPRIAVETNRGVLVFMLLADEAPFHVENVLQLAQRGHYDGTTFHRVVPDFVVQGGDVRGDGNGGTTWRSDATAVVPLRGEFGPRPFRRGSLGMPRNDDPDSGGSQLFVTHRDTPNLDGRYTLFGELVAGFDVLDAIQVGDVIEHVRVLPAEDARAD